MIQLIGIKNYSSIEVREKLSIIHSQYEKSIENLLSICSEVVVISTCNRTEIYFDSECTDESIVEKIFNLLNWNLCYKEFTFHIEGRRAIQHLMEVSCGFHSKILGEDQILGQIKNAYEISLNMNAVKKELQRLFQMAITCGKEFRVKSEMYKIPVSSSSIVVNESRKRNFKDYMLIGFGEVGKLTAKYILSGEFNKLYIVVRNKASIDIEDERIKVLSYSEKNDYYDKVQCIICCTSAPHPVVLKNEVEEKNLVIFDLAVPRDVEEEVSKLENIELFTIDDISYIDDENKKKRKELMNLNRCIVNDYIDEFIDWQKIREISPYIEKLLNTGEKVYKPRYNTFKNKQKTKDNKELAKMLIKSTSDAYINRAIEVLKEEQLEGRSEECLRIIEKIFFHLN